jgi:hypothetical protein
MRRTLWLFAFLVAATAFRLAYGLSMPFWYEDERQVYLIGLKSFARGEWPMFGADVVWTEGRVPGALLGWLIRAPLELFTAPEAPFVLLNLLSVAALAFFAWYLGRRLALVPRWLIWAPIFVLPWTLNFSTHVTNPSYVLTGAIVFFVGFLEALPALSRRILAPAVAWALMGFGLMWVVQIHMSWVLLPPFVVAAFVGVALARRTFGEAMVALAGFVAGASLPALLIVPTWVEHGLAAGHVGGVVDFQWRGPFGIVSTAARMLSFASFEIGRFIGMDTFDRVLLFWRQPWLLPFAAVLFGVGILHPLWMAVTGFRSVQWSPGASAPGSIAPAREWRATRVLFAASVLLVYVSFFWSVRGPQAHAFYVMWPVAAFFAFMCWEVRASARGGRLRGFERVAVVALASSIVLHAGLALDRRPRLSLYADRDLVAAAIAEPNDRYLGDRRDSLPEPVDRTPRSEDAIADPQAFLTADPLTSIEVVRTDWTSVLDRVSVLTLTIANRSRAAAWVDIRYGTAYLGDLGQLLAVRNGVIKRIIQPGEERVFADLSDGGVPPGTRSVSVTVTGAERVVPVQLMARER